MTDLDLPERLKYRQSFSPVLYIKGGFLPSMGQRFITKYAALEEVKDDRWNVLVRHFETSHVVFVMLRA